MDNNIGALWIKNNSRGEFYTGKIKLDNGEEIKIVVFKNNFKNKDNQPDYTILKAREQQQLQEQEEDNITKSNLPF